MGSLVEGAVAVRVEVRVAVTANEEPRVVVSSSESSESSAAVVLAAAEEVVLVVEEEVLVEEVEVEVSGTGVCETSSPSTSLYEAAQSVRDWPSGQHHVSPLLSAAQ